MTVCATCSRGLQPEWKFCIYCGTPTGVPVTAAIQIIRAAADAVDSQQSLRARLAVSEEALAAPVTATTPDHAVAPTPAAPAAPAAATNILWGAGSGEVLRAEDIPDDDEPSLPAAESARPTAKFNVLAILAVILGCLASPLAAVFGHIALAQISRSGERGTALAWAAVVLGYLSLAALLVLGISYIVLNA